MSKKCTIRLDIIIFCACLSLVQSGPIHRYVRVMREVYPEIEPEKVDGNQPQVCIVGDVVYEAEEAVPADQPCLKCKCQPPGVHCETIRCLKKPGCRAIHKPNKCCPDYQCECEHEGKIYANGERLESKPGGECQVCYCRGGEVQCTEVSCYMRTDCEGRTVPGQCCPKYEHCPAIEPSSGKMSPKPETEDRDATTKTFSEPSPTNASSENEIAETTAAFDTKDENLVVGETTSAYPTRAKAEPEEDLDPKITIHEIIPEIKEIPITEPPPKQEDALVQGQLLVEEEEKVPPSNSNDVVGEVEDSDLESSELSEVFQHPPPVLRIGDQLLFLKKGELVPEKDASTPSPVFTIIGAEGLQRGDIESMEHHETQKETLIDEETKKNRTEVLTPTPDDNTTIDVAVVLANAELEENKNETSSEMSTTTRKAMDEEQKIKIEEIVQLENPAYPPIPDIMSQQGAEYIDHGEMADNTSREPLIETVDSKILPEFLPARKNTTTSENTTNSAWLKGEEDGRSLVNEKAALPEELLKEIAPSDLDVTTDSIPSTTEENFVKQGKRSSDLPTDTPPIASGTFNDQDLLKYGTIVEGDPLVENQVKKLADEDDFVISSSASGSTENYSGESTTPKGLRASMMDSSEDASVEGQRAKEEPASSSEEEKYKKDVELIDPSTLNSTKTNLTTHEENSKEYQQDRVEKRTISATYDPDSDKIFQELDTELHLLDGGADGNAKSHEEEKKEAEIIFRELLDEVNASTAKTPKVGGGKKGDSDVLQRVSDAIAKFQLKEARQSLDVNILGILRDFFTSQYRSYKDV